MNPVRELKKLAAKIEEETRTYEISGKPHQLNGLEGFLGTIAHLGDVGASRTLKIRVDGDGDVRLKVTRFGEAVEPHSKTDLEKDEALNIGLD